MVFTTRVVIPYIQACMNEFLTVTLVFKHCFINKHTHSSCMYDWMTENSFEMSAQNVDSF